MILMMPSCGMAFRHFCQIVLPVVRSRHKTVNWNESVGLSDRPSPPHRAGALRRIRADTCRISAGYLQWLGGVEARPFSPKAPPPEQNTRSPHTTGVAETVAGQFNFPFHILVSTLGGVNRAHRH